MHAGYWIATPAIAHMLFAGCGAPELPQEPVPRAQGELLIPLQSMLVKQHTQRLLFLHRSRGMLCSVLGAATWYCCRFWKSTVLRLFHSAPQCYVFSQCYCFFTVVLFLNSHRVLRVCHCAARTFFCHRRRFWTVHGPAPPAFCRCCCPTCWAPPHVMHDIVFPFSLPTRA